MAKTKKEKETEAARLSDCGLIVRSFRAVPSTVDEKEMSIDAVFSTENAVSVFDWERFEIVNEVLLMSGMEFPEQIPLLDSHNRASIKDQLGSARNMRIENNQLVGKIFFSSAEESKEAFIKAREGHLTDLSIGYQPSGIWIEEGAEWVAPDGRKFMGPLKVSTKTLVKEVSLTPIGADALAKTRSAIGSIDKGELDALRKENTALKADLNNARFALKLVTKQ